MEREACVCDHGLERSDLCAEIIIIIIRRYFQHAPFIPIVGVGKIGAY